MKFILHTIIYWQDKPVYYNIYEIGCRIYFAEIIDNPYAIPSAISFEFNCDDECQSEANVSEKQLYWLGEDLQKYLPKSTTFKE